MHLHITRENSMKICMRVLVLYNNRAASRPVPSLDLPGGVLERAELTIRKNLTYEPNGKPVEGFT